MTSVRSRPVRVVATSVVAGALLLTLGVAARPSVGAATAVTVPDSIDRSGRTDVTDALNAFLAGVGPGTTVGFPAGGRYRVDGTLTLTNRRDVTIEGNGATFFAVTDGSGVVPPRGGPGRSWPRLRAGWRIRGGGGITVHDLTVQGANAKGGANAGAYVPRLEGQAGIAVQRAAGVVLDSVHVTNTYGDAVYLTGGASNVTIRNSTLEKTGRQGVAIVGAQHVTVEDNQIRDVARSVFDLEPPGRALVADVHLRDNRVGSYVNFLLASGGGGPGVRDVWLQGNQISGGHGLSVYAGVANQRRTGYHVLDNTGSGAQRPPGGTGRPGLLQLINLDQVEVRGNHQAVAGVPAISLDRVCGVTVADNQFPGASTEQQVVRACGAAGPNPTGPSSRPRPAPVPRVPPTAAAAPTPATPSSGSNVGEVVLVGLGGFALGLGVAAAVFAAWRRGRAGAAR